MKNLKFGIVMLVAAGAGLKLISEFIDWSDKSDRSLTHASTLESFDRGQNCVEGVAQVGCLTVPPPAERRSIRSHPRLLVTSESLPQLREKLAKPEYKQDVARIRASKHPTDQAFVHLVWGDASALESAKNALFSGSVPPWKRMQQAIVHVQYALMYDWLYQSLSDEERSRAREAVMKKFPSGLKNLQREVIHYYHNDNWNRGPSYAPIVALALAGEDQWADAAIEAAYTGEHRIFSPYLGGAVDTLNTLSLESGGGLQAGTNPLPGSGYESMFVIGAPLFLAAWQSATGEQLLSKTNFLKTYPYYALYSSDNGVTPGWSPAKQIFEYVTGLYSGETAELSAWMLEKYGRSSHPLCLRLILGDLTSATAKSPEALGLPLARYIEGADLVSSRTGWGDDDISVFMFARHWDTSRYEPDSGLVSIYRGSEPLLVRGTSGKLPFDVRGVSGIWLWTENDFRGLRQGSTYWRSLVPENAERAISAAQVLHPERVEFRPQTLLEFSSAAGVTRATTRYDTLLRIPEMKSAVRTLVHDGRSVHLFDSLTGVPRDTSVAWTLRLAEEPVINGNTISTTDLNITFTGPESEIFWIGGEGRELEGPSGRWQGNKKDGFVPGYSKSKKLVKRFGLGYLFAIPKVPSENYEFKAEIDIR